MRTSNHRSVIISASPVRRVVGFLSRVVLQSDGMKQILRLNSPECRRNPAYQTYLSILTFNHGASLAEPAACSDRGTRLCMSHEYPISRFHVRLHRRRRRVVALTRVETERLSNMSVKCGRARPLNRPNVRP